VRHYHGPVVEVQTVLSARGVPPEELVISVRSLLFSVRSLAVAHADEPTMQGLRDRFGESVRGLDSHRPGVPLLVAPGRVVFAFGAVRRILAQTGVPGRCVTRVYLPGLEDGQYVACWSASFLRLYPGPLASLVEADLDFDRTHLSVSSPTARSWVPAHALGVSTVGDVSGDLRRWWLATGLALDARSWWSTGVRGPAGGARRRLARRGHRRRGRTPQRLVR